MSLVRIDSLGLWCYDDFPTPMVKVYIRSQSATAIGVTSRGSLVKLWRRQGAIMPKNTNSHTCDQLKVGHMYVTICDLIFRSIAANGCPTRKHWHEHTTLNFLKPSIALGSKDDIFARENEIASLNVFLPDFSLRTDLVFLRFIYSPRI